MESKEHMNRLTEKNEFGYILHIKSADNSLENEIAIIGNPVDKLGQLEDIEEELGIDLITLFEALKNKVYSKHPETGEVSRIILTELYYCTRKWNIGCVSMKFNKQENSCDSWDCNPKDYGKTWALTKEELEK